MLVSLIPLFDEELHVCAYSLFTQKTNVLLNASILGAGQNDNAVLAPGLEVLDRIGAETLSGDKVIFVPINNIAIFTDIREQCHVSPKKIVLLIDNMVLPEEKYITRLTELKKQGYKLAIRKLTVAQFEPYKPILNLVDYIFLNHKKIFVDKAKVYFENVYPNIKLCAVNIQTQEIFEELCATKGYSFYEGEFYRMPVTKGETQVAPLKVNYVELLNTINDEEFELSKAADIISRDTALVISLLKIVNRISINSEITSIQHAAAMLGQRELRKWLTTAITNELCADKPNEITRLSLVRAKFAENLAPTFEMAMSSSELFLMGLFSVLDLILEMPMEKALEKVKVSKEIREALINRKGKIANVLDFIIQYENANWQEVSRQMIIYNIEINQVYDAYIQCMEWYRDLFK